jgi:putative two-component system response regulator
VILDLMMPGMDGLEVLRQMRADLQTTDVPVVILTAVSDPQLIEHAKEKGASDYWIKAQVDYTQLKRMVGPYLGAAG